MVKIKLKKDEKAIVDWTIIPEKKIAIRRVRWFKKGG